MLLSEFECPRTILIKDQQQQLITLEMVPSTLDMEPSTLDPRQKDRLAGMMLCCLFAYISVFCLDRCHFALVPVKEDSASPPSSPGAS